MTRSLVGVALLLVASFAQAQTVITPDTTGKGVLTTGQVATGMSTSAVDTTGGYSTMVITYLLNAGTATIETDVNCEKVVSGALAAASWMVVANSSIAMSGAPSVNGIGITYPYCVYRTQVTACAGCSVTTKFALGRIK